MCFHLHEFRLHELVYRPNSRANRDPTVYAHDMWFGLESMLVSYADDATVVARTPSPNMRSNVTVTESL